MKVGECPNYAKTVAGELKRAGKVIDDTKSFDDLYEAMSKKFNVDRDKINFLTAHKYLDDVLCARNNDKPSV